MYATQSEVAANCREKGKTMTEMGEWWEEAPGGIVSWRTRVRGGEVG